MDRCVRRVMASHLDTHTGRLTEMNRKADTSMVDDSGGKKTQGGG